MQVHSEVILRLSEKRTNATKKGGTEEKKN